MNRKEAKEVRQAYSITRKNLRYHTQGEFTPKTPNDVHVIFSVGARSHEAFEFMVKPCVDRSLEKFIEYEASGSKALYSSYCDSTILVASGRVGGYVRMFVCLATELDKPEICMPELAEQFRKAMSKSTSVWCYEVNPDPADGNHKTRSVF